MLSLDHGSSYSGMIVFHMSGRRLQRRMERTNRKQAELSTGTHWNQRKRKESGPSEYWGSCMHWEARLIIGSLFPLPSIYGAIRTSG